MKFRNTIWFLAVAVTVVAWVYWQEQHGKPSTREDALKAGRVLEVRPEAVHTIRIVNGTSIIELARHGTEWRMTRPIRDRADVSVVGALLQELETLHSRESLKIGRRTEKSTVNPEVIGLTQPKTQIAFERDGSEAPTIVSFGRETPYSGTVYVRVNEDSEVHVVNNRLRDLALEDARAFRDRSLAGRISVDDITRILLKRQSGEIELAREKGKWRMLRPSQSPAKPARIEQVLKSIEQARIVEFRGGLASGHPARTLEGRDVGLSLFVSHGDPVIDFVLRDVGGSETVIVEDFVRRISATVDSRFLESLLISPMVLRDASLAKVELDAVDAITMMGSGKRLRLIRSGDHWAIEGKENVQADPTLIEALVGLLADDEGADLISEAASPEDLDLFGFKNPLMRIEFSSVLTENSLYADAGEHLVCSVEFGNRLGDRIYARNPDESSVVLVPGARVDAIDLSPEFWEDRRFFRCDPDEIVEVAVLNMAGATFRWSSMDGSWWIQRAGVRKVDEGMVALFVDTLCTLRHAGESPRPDREADFVVELSRWNPDLQEAKKIPRLRIWVDANPGGSVAHGGAAETVGRIEAGQIKFLRPFFAILQ
jgi:hypothetical protein